MIPEAEQQITELLRVRHRLGDKPDDFDLRHPVEQAQMLEEQAQTMELLVASVAAVSLLVGSVGIMNIMLVSVTERTREIGIRLAVGAKGRDIRFQFLIEAVMLCLVGGGLGILAGAGGARVVSSTLGWPVQVSPRAVALALVISTAIGVFFGLRPQRPPVRIPSAPCNSNDTPRTFAIPEQRCPWAPRSTTTI